MNRDFIAGIWERFYPEAVAVVAFMAGWWYEFLLPTPDEGLLGSSLTLGAILTGFLATSKAVLLGLRDTDIWRHLQEKQLDKRVIRYLSRAITGAFAFSLWSLLGYFSALEVWLYPLIWLFLAAYTAAAFWRFTRVLFAIITAERKSHNVPGDK